MHAGPSRLTRDIQLSRVGLKLTQAHGRHTITLLRHASQSSNLWLDRQKRDVYKKMSRYENYRARSAYKLIQIDDKYKFLQPGKIVIEAGSAPGSWTQVICERLDLVEKQKPRSTKGACIAVELGSMAPVEGAVCLNNTDFTSPFTQAKILDWLNGRKVDCVLSDMAPAASGNKDYDHLRQIHLVKKLVPFSLRIMQSGTGILLAKIWSGQETDALLAELSKQFSSVKQIKPDASRKESSEMFVLCRGFKGEHGIEAEQISNHDSRES